MKANPFDHCPDPDCDCVDCLQWIAYELGHSHAAREEDGSKKQLKISFALPRSAEEAP